MPVPLQSLATSVKSLKSLAFLLFFSMNLGPELGPALLGGNHTEISIVRQCPSSNPGPSIGHAHPSTHTFRFNLLLLGFCGTPLLLFC